MTLRELRDFVASPQVASLHELTEVRLEPLAVDSRGYIAEAHRPDDVLNDPVNFARNHPFTCRRPYQT